MVGTPLFAILPFNEAPGCRCCRVEPSLTLVGLAGGSTGFGVLTYVHDVAGAQKVWRMHQRPLLRVP
jgi:hypothetical protein